MPTVAERQALLFLVSVALVGGGVRAFESHRRDVAMVDSAAADSSGEGVGAQLASVDSARGASRGASRGRAGGKRGVSRARAGAMSRDTPRADSSRRWGRQQQSRSDRTVAPNVAIDVDVASAEELERLPRIGAALAQRIVANRDSLGGFGSLQALTRVRGIGPALVRQLAPMVTFSSGPSPFHGEPRKRPR